MNVDPIGGENYRKQIAIPTVSSSSRETELEHVDVKPMIVFSANEKMVRETHETETRQVEHIKVEPIIFRDDRLAGDKAVAGDCHVQASSSSHELREKAEASSGTEDESAKVQIEQDGNSCSSETTTENLDSNPPKPQCVTAKVHQDGNKRPTSSEMIKSLEPGQHFTTVVTNGPLKATAICIRPTPTGNSELFLEPEPSARVKYWLRLCQLHGKKHDFDVHLPRPQDIVVIMTRTGDSTRSFEIVMSYATKFGIAHYFRNDSETGRKWIPLGYEPIVSSAAATSLRPYGDDQKCTEKFPDGGGTRISYSTPLENPSEAYRTDKPAAAEIDSCVPPLSGVSNDVEDGVRAGPSENGSCKHLCKQEVQTQAQDNLLCKLEDGEIAEESNDESHIVKASCCAEENVLSGDSGKLRKAKSQDNSQRRKKMWAKARNRSSSSSREKRRKRVEESYPADDNLTYYATTNLFEETLEPPAAERFEINTVHDGGDYHNVQGARRSEDCRQGGNLIIHIPRKKKKGWSKKRQLFFSDQPMEASAEFRGGNGPTLDQMSYAAVPNETCHAPSNLVPGSRAAENFEINAGDDADGYSDIQGVRISKDCHYETNLVNHVPNKKKKRWSKKRQQFPWGQQMEASAVTTGSNGVTAAESYGVDPSVTCYAPSNLFLEIVEPRFVHIEVQQMQSTQAPAFQPMAYYNQTNAPWQANATFSNTERKQFLLGQPMEAYAVTNAGYDESYGTYPNVTCHAPSNFYQESLEPYASAECFETNAVYDGNGYQTVQDVGIIHGHQHGANLVNDVPRKREKGWTKKKQQLPLRQAMEASSMTTGSYRTPDVETHGRHHGANLPNRVPRKKKNGCSKKIRETLKQSNVQSRNRNRKSRKAE